MKLILQTLLSAAFVVATVQPSAAVEPRITGVIRVIDGDTIALGKTRIRLFGIDAVEGDQPCTAADGTVLNCGAWVSSLVHQSYDGQRADCVRVDTDRYGRTVARCKALGQDMGQALVAAGLAFSYARYSRDYVKTEAAAKRAGRGVHAYETQRPDVFRKASKTATKSAASAGPGGCQIKGNVSSKGTRIFHMPGQRDYDRTVIRTDKGEYWFCTAAQARAAGWRAAKR
jgi:endonuclease YncB( thermonuclease family)